MQLDGRFAVFQFVILADGAARQFTLFSDGHETHAQLVRDCAAQNEPARFQPDNLVDAHACIGMEHLINCHSKTAWVGKKRGHIAKHDPFVGEIDDGADIVLYGFHGLFNSVKVADL